MPLIQWLQNLPSGPQPVTFIGTGSYEQRTIVQVMYELLTEVRVSMSVVGTVSIDADIVEP